MFGVYNLQAMEGFNAILMGKRVDCYKNDVFYAEPTSEELSFKASSLSACQPKVGGHGDLRVACRNPDTWGYLEDEKQSVPPSPLLNAPLRGTRLPIFKKGNRYNALWRVPKTVASETTLSGLEDVSYATSGQNNTLEDSNGDPKTDDGTLLQITPLSLRRFPSNDSITKTRGALYKWKRHLLSEVPQRDCTPVQCLNITVTKLQSTPPSYVDTTSKPPLPRSGFEVSNPSASPAGRTTLPLKKHTRTRYFQSLTSSGAHFAICAHLPTRAYKKGRRPTLSVFTVYQIEINALSDVGVRRHVKDLFTVKKAFPLHHDASALNLATGDNPDVISDSGKFTIITAKKRNKRRCRFKNSFSGEKRNRDASGNHVVKLGKGAPCATSARKRAIRNKSLEQSPSSRPEPPDVEIVRLENNTSGEHLKFSPNCKTVKKVLSNNDSSLGAGGALRNYHSAVNTCSAFKHNSMLNTELSELNNDTTTNTKLKFNTNSTLSINSALNGTCRRVNDVLEISGSHSKKQSQVRACERSRCSQNGADQALNNPTLNSGHVKAKAEDGRVLSLVCHQKCAPNTKKRYQIGRLRTESRPTDPVGSCGREKTKGSITCPDGSNEFTRTHRTPRIQSAANKCVTVEVEFDSDQDTDDVVDSTKFLNMAKVQCMRDCKRNGRDEVIRKLLDCSAQERKDKSRSPKDLNSANEARILPKVKFDGPRSRNRNTNHDDTWLLEQRQERTDWMPNGTDWTERREGQGNSVDTTQGGGIPMDDDDMIDTVSQCNDLFNSSQIFESDPDVTSPRNRSGVIEKIEHDADEPESAGNGPCPTNRPSVCERSEQWGKNESVSGKNIQQKESGVMRGEEDGNALNANLEISCVNTKPGIERSNSTKQWAMHVKDARNDDESLRQPPHSKEESAILSGPSDFQLVKDDFVPHMKSRNQKKTVEGSIMNLGPDVETANLKKVSSDDLEKMCYRGSLFPNLGHREYLSRRGEWPSVGEDKALESLGNGQLEKPAIGNKRSTSRRSSYEQDVTGATKIHEANGGDDVHGCVQVEISKQRAKKEEPSDGTTLVSGPVDGCSFNVAVGAHNDEAQQACNGADARSSPWMLLRKTLLPTVPDRLPERQLLSRRRQALRFIPHNTSLRFNPQNTSMGQSDRAGASGDCQNNPAKPRICINGKGMTLESPFSDEHRRSPNDSSGKCKGGDESTMKPVVGKVADPGCEKSVRLPQLLGYGDSAESTRCDGLLQNPVSAQTADSIKAAQKNFTYSTDFVYYGKAKVDTWLKSAYH